MGADMHFVIEDDNKRRFRILVNQDKEAKVIMREILNLPHLTEDLEKRMLAFLEVDTGCQIR